MLRFNIFSTAAEEHRAEITTFAGAVAREIESVAFPIRTSSSQCPRSRGRVISETIFVHDTSSNQAKVAGKPSVTTDDLIQNFHFVRLGAYMQGPTVPPRYQVLLFRERGVDGKQLEEVASWFERFPGPVVIEAQSRSVQLTPNPVGDLKWDVLFGTLRRLRSESNAPDSSFVFLLTKTPNERNWYAAEDPDQMRNGFGHFADFSWVTTAPSSVIAAHYILKATFNALLQEAEINWEKMWHQEPRGCFFDFCQKKIDLAFKLRTADICGDCMEIFQSAGIPDSLLKQTIQIMEASRRRALNTGQYLPAEYTFGDWPFPVAITRHKVVQASNPVLRFMLLLDHFDSLVRYSYLAHEINAGRTPALEEKPSLGWWVGQLASCLNGDIHLREVVRIAEQEKIVNLRNERRGHGWMSAGEEDYRAEAEDLEPILAAIEFEMLPFFRAHRLVIPRQISLKNGAYLVEGEDLIGSHLFHPGFDVSLQDPRAAGIANQNEVYLCDTSYSIFKCMSPVIRSTTCPECRHPRILIADGTKKYIDVFIGHRVNL